MSTTLTKPTKVHRPVLLDYHQCRDYLQAKHGYNERDYARHFHGADAATNDRPYQDFWHWVCDICCPENGGTITLSDYLLDSCKEPWQREILERYLSEFGEGQDRSCTFVTEW